MGILVKSGRVSKGLAFGFYFGAVPPFPCVYLYGRGGRRWDLGEGEVGWAHKQLFPEVKISLSFMVRLWAI